MALTVAGRDIRPLTADEAMRMVAAGIIGEDERVELLDGVLTAMSPQHTPHAVVVQRLTRWLAPAMVAGTHDVRVQLPFRVPDPTSLPEPDIAVVPDGAPTTDHPSVAVLVVEVACTSHRIDLQVKPTLYAAAGIREAWVVDVPGRRVHVLERPADGRYTATRVVDVSADATLQPRHVATAPLRLADLLAGL